MKKLYVVLLLIVLFSLKAASQQNTEVYITNITAKDNHLAFSKPLNISNNDGYDNQPSFLDNNNMLFTSTRNKQTDIKKYDFETNTLKWLTDTPNGSEYSPTKIPEKKAFSSIRLDESGLQRLYSYKLKNGTSKELVKDTKIGYHVWYTKHLLVTTVLVENRMDLVIVNLKDKTKYTFQKNVGRSLHKIPNTDLVSYISLENEELVLKATNPISGATKTVVTLPKGTTDVCWLQDGTIVTGLKNVLLKFKPETDTNWKEISRFADDNINNISRLAVSPNGKTLALVAEVSPEVIINKQVAFFNKRDLKAFVSCFSDKVVVSNYAKSILYSGKSKLKSSYEAFYARTPNVNVEIMNRITVDATVIDEEQVFMGDKEQRQAAIYQIDNGLIKTMTFVYPEGGNQKLSENIVQQQLDAYNNRNIDAFLAMYSKDIEIYTYMGHLQSKGLDKMKESYAEFFKKTPDLHCELKNRIVIGNKIIDQEWITANGAKYSAIAIYEVIDGKIAKVTFI